MTINWQDALAVYFIAGTQDIQPNEELIDALEEALKAGATCFQYREKGTGSMMNPDEPWIWRAAVKKFVNVMMCHLLLTMILI